MNHLCTVSDSKYVWQGMVLYESLKRHSRDIVLHYYCINDESYEIVNQFKDENLKVYKVDDLVAKDERLRHLKNTEYPYFCWSLASYLSNKMLETDIDAVTYVDSDIYFHKSINTIFEEIGDRDVGIFRHRKFLIGGRMEFFIKNIPTMQHVGIKSI